MELSKQKSYQQAFDLACASLREKDLRERAEKAGVDYDNGGKGEKIHILFFSESYTIRFPEIEFSSPRKKTISLVTLGIVSPPPSQSRRQPPHRRMGRLQRPGRRTPLCRRLREKSDGAFDQKVWKFG